MTVCLLGVCIGKNKKNLFLRGPNGLFITSFGAIHQGSASLDFLIGAIVMYMQQIASSKMYEIQFQAVVASRVRVSCYKTCL